MAVAAFWPSTQPAHQGVEGRAPTAFTQLFGAICAVPIVRRVVVPDPRGTLDIWVQLSADDEEQEAWIYRALQEYRATEAPMAVDLHVIFADESDNALPAHAPVAFERR